MKVAPSQPTLLDEVRAAARQEQFLEVISAESARQRLAAHIDTTPMSAERVALASTLGRVLAVDILATVDAPPFDRSGVDGFAIRAADSLGASDQKPVRLKLNNEVLRCGVAPREDVAPGTATAIATGGVVPRGADAVVMIEWTELIESDDLAIDLSRAVNPGQFISYAGSDIARGETALRKGAKIGSRELGILAASGTAVVDVVRRPRVAVLSTGDELVAPGAPLRQGAVYDSNGAIVAAAVSEAGGDPQAFGIVGDDENALRDVLTTALSTCDMVVLSGGTSKGAGDLSYRVASTLGQPGVIVHGVALKPGKPLCIAVVDKKPLIILPGFPTSAIFTFHTFVAPIIRARAGLPPETAREVEATIPVRIASEMGREEFVMVALTEGESGLTAFPSNKGSGSVTTFSQSDGFLTIDALSTSLDAGARARVRLIDPDVRVPDLVIAGSHCVALDVLISALSQQGIVARSMAVGSQGGVTAARRGECDLAPIHLIDPQSGIYNQHLVTPGFTLVPGWRRMQGVVFRKDDPRFAGLSASEAVAAALADSSSVMVNRNAGAGTRILIDQALNGARPRGYGNQPKSHNAVAAAVAQRRADWGVAIEPVAQLYDLGFAPLAPEHYDFLLLDARRDRFAVRAFLKALRDPDVIAGIRARGMQVANDPVVG
ncbi:molybdopterin molybdenumtransferase [Variibacter gotjawalensis]|uniref:Molybdopterin molybdenumtransferase n=1 Tax=Variibacter gotjawalensis TaxID=1333996 RepID=A0A0S3PWS1_9BRAD|nr:molybdopterin biosynthesis protein [Variibacter gotjawalensis]NIK46217.1 putative molybdopterin biosynthesis protein [Variibacter gotjawalensis]RZS48133.1 molybdopterin molybdochelatase [Variibacter gotjawalensis]BAT60390.1 molybdopterin molybdenumtransferase [Variibacter gotjawalensis]